MVSKCIITPTEESLLLVREISESVPTFHHHYHILYDIGGMFHRHITYLEIGTFKGASACLMLQRRNTEVITMDTGRYATKDEIDATLKKFNPYNNGFWYIEGDSHDEVTKKLIRYGTAEGIDILFIDGDHSEEGLTKDFTLYSDLVNSGGFVVFDDYNDWQYNPQVKVAIDKLVATLSGFEVIGTLRNDLGAKPAEQKDGICFILRKI